MRGGGDGGRSEHPRTTRNWEGTECTKRGIDESHRYGEERGEALSYNTDATETGLNTRRTKNDKQGRVEALRGDEEEGDSGLSS